MPSTDAKELMNEHSQIKSQISELRSKLNTLNDKKEGVFKEKDKYSEQIIGLISQIKELKKERDAFTRKVKELKKEREENNEKIKKFSAVLKEQFEARDNIKDKSDTRIDPDKVRREIDSLEFKIETEGLSFEKEKNETSSFWRIWVPWEIHPAYFFSNSNYSR